MSKPKVEPLRLGRRRKQPEKPPSSTGTSLLWELMEMEAPEKFCVNGKEHAAFLLFPKCHWAASKGYHHLYMNTVGLIGKYTARAKALERLREIVETANFALKVYRVSKYGRNRGKRIFFAENHVQRVEPSEFPTKVFNIKEWEGLAR